MRYSLPRNTWRKNIAKLARAKLNKCSGDADLSKDMSGPESPPELWRSWCVEGHIRFGVISSVLAQWNNEPLGLRRSRSLEDRSRTKEKARRERPKSRGKRYGHQETSLDSQYEEGSKDTYEDLNSPYKRPKPAPFTKRITRFKYHQMVKLPQNIRVFEGNKDPEDHLRPKPTPFTQRITRFKTYHNLGVIDLRVTMGEAERNKTVLMEFAIVKCHSSYTVIIGRTGMRSLRAVGSTIHSMIEFPTNQRIVTMETSREALRECKQLEKDKENTKEILTISQERLNQHVTMGTTLTADCKRLLTDVLRENIEVFAWAGSERTIVPRLIMEHQLKIYPLAEPVVHKRRPMTPDGRHALKERVFRWLKEGTIRKVQHPEWVANTIPVKSRGRKVPRTCGDEGRNKSRPRKSAGNHPKPHPKRSKPNTKFIPATDNHRQVYPKTCGAQTYEISYIQRKEAERSVVKKFFGQGEQVQKTPDVNEGETFNLSKKLQAKLTPTPRAWRLYLGKEAMEEGLGVGIILVSPDEKIHSYVIHLKFKASDHAMDYEALLAGLVTFISKCMKDLHVFIDSLTLVADDIK
nr:hypothetical protein [Tanacetum cinerariifolium]